jgi:hypothetical protein
MMGILFENYAFQYFTSRSYKTGQILSDTTDTICSSHPILSCLVHDTHGSIYYIQAFFQIRKRIFYLLLCSIYFE